MPEEESGKLTRSSSSRVPAPSFAVVSVSSSRLCTSSLPVISLGDEIAAIPDISSVAASTIFLARASSIAACVAWRIVVIVIAISRPIGTAGSEGATDGIMHVLDLGFQRIIDLIEIIDAV